ncbi:MAG: TRAP transporter large permease [Dehalococcoidia bacterium]|nr:MAG: TRAP transporter large permease [Dehalococcoidia bacterium]
MSIFIVLAVGLIVAIGLMIIRVPVGFAFGIGSIILIFGYGLGFDWIAPHALRFLGSFTLLAFPLFILLGNLMGRSGLADRLIDFVQSIIRRAKSSLGAVVVLTCSIFGAISGSALAAIGAIGPIVMPRMAQDGYPRGYATGIVACSSLIAMLIPPSLPMIIYGLVGQVPISLCFLATIIPGLLIICSYLIINALMCRRMPIAAPAKNTFIEYSKNIGATGKRASLILLLPIIILGGIYGGVFTPTEAAAVGIIYCIPIMLLVYRTTNFGGVVDSTVQAASFTGSALALFFFLVTLSHILVLAEVPKDLANIMMRFSENKYVLLAMLNILLLFIGMIMDDGSGTLLAAAILLPVAKEIGIDPLHFAAIVAVNIGLGNVTPPVAPLLYIAGRIGEVPFNEYIKPALVFMIFGHLPVVILTTYFPALSLTLPRLFTGG